MAFPLPDPALADDVVRLRPWSAADADALVAAWTDPEIRQWTRVPEQRSATDALRWIAAERLRRDRGLALDLVVAPADPDDPTVLGEVGVLPLAGGPARAELGWWVAAAHRRQGIATRAVGLVSAWLRTDLGFDDLFAEVDLRNPPSVWVAEATGLRLRISRAGDDV
jgi:RimJ/RimL family protein N-acetyltransferase